MKKMNVICDVCQAAFKLKGIETEIMEDDYKVEHGFFKCPKCGKLYTVYYADVEWRKNVDRIVACGDRITTLRNILSYKTKKLTNAKFVKYHNEFKALMDEQAELTLRNKVITKNYKKKYEKEELVCQN